jgi:hypothetical protein
MKTKPILTYDSPTSGSVKATREDLLKLGVTDAEIEAGKKRFEMETWGPTIEKLGCIDYETVVLGENAIWSLLDAKNNRNEPELTVVNSYTQNYYGKNHSDGVSKPLDYEALTLCMRKINSTFRGKHIGMPKIGAGLAGGDWNRIKKIIQTELKDCKVTIVIYNK